MTVLPQPKAPGIAVVPPCTHLKKYNSKFEKYNSKLKKYNSKLDKYNSNTYSYSSILTVNALMLYNDDGIKTYLLTGTKRPVLSVQ